MAAAAAGAAEMAPATAAGTGMACRPPSSCRRNSWRNETATTGTGTAAAGTAADMLAVRAGAAVAQNSSAGREAAVQSDHRRCSAS